MIAAGATSSPYLYTFFFYDVKLCHFEYKVDFLGNHDVIIDVTRILASSTEGKWENIFLR